MEQNGKANLGYTLFLYREKLRRRDAHLRLCASVRLSRTKIELTEELISQKVQHIHDCSMEDLKVISRELMFKKQLKKDVSCMRKLLKMGVRWNPNALTTEL